MGSGRLALVVSHRHGMQRFMTDCKTHGIFRGLFLTGMSQVGVMHIRAKMIARGKSFVVGAETKGFVWQAMELGRSLIKNAQVDGLSIISTGGCSVAGSAE
jgi:hypothetical protein